MKVRNEIVVCFTGDHSTPASAKEHTSDPVPILLRYPGCRKDGVGEFDEIKAKDGYLLKCFHCGRKFLLHVGVDRPGDTFGSEILQTYKSANPREG